jgi:integrase
MPFGMAALNRSKSGAYTARKGIPKDVQEEYERLYGHRWEAKLTLPATLKSAEAKAQYGEWLATIETRIDTIRSHRNGGGQTLSQKQARALAGEWYRWFVVQHEDNPGAPRRWEQNFWALIERLEEHAPENVLAESWKNLDWIREPEVLNGIRPVLAKETKADAFLADKGHALAQEARTLFLDCVLEEYIAVTLLLERRAQGDFSPDERLEQFPAFESAPKVPKVSEGLTSWKLFEVWVAAKQPGRATVDRSRSVFLHLDKHFEGRSANSITPDDAQAWADQLLTGKRSAATVNDIWCNAARTVFGWGAKARKLTRNPFEGVSITQPRKIRTRETDEFSSEEATRILAASLRFDTAPGRPFDAARRWVPWLCAYTGARAGEITQLRGKDVVQHDGIWAIQITPEAGSVKTGRPRTVPLHEHLLEQGFLDFVAAKGKGPLFYNDQTPLKGGNTDPTNPARPRSVKTWERLADWVRNEVGVKDKAIRPNHAWRHTFKRRAARAGIEAGTRDAICGHSPRSIADQYETPTLADMAEALKKFPRYETEERPS